MMSETSTTRNERTCAGCGKRDHADALVRVVLGPEGDVAVDAANGAFGRGAHLHPKRACLEKAARGGLSRSYKSEVKADPKALAAEIVAGADRRIAGLLGGAKRGGHLAVGNDAVREAIADAKLVVVAADAAAGADSREVRSAIDAGKALVWGTKKILGSALAREEVAVCAVLADGVSKAIVSAHGAARELRSEAWSSEVR